MAIFIPDAPYEGTKSEAEINFFNTLKNELDIEDAYVFHSLGLPKHSKKIFGEADFIIVCSRGILCLEVKGGSVEYKNGNWEYTNRHGNHIEQNKNPFAQAKGNILELRNSIEKHTNIIGSYSYVFGVVFPDIYFNTDTVEYPKQLVYDLGTESVTAYINGIFDLEYETKKRYPLPPAKIKQIVDYLRPDFCFIETLANRLQKNEKQILRLTRQQAEVLDSLKRTKHIAIEAGAGMGKTVLAQEYAKQKAIDDKKVLFITYNKNIAHFVKQNLAEYKNIDVRNIHTVFDAFEPYSEEKQKELKKEYFASYWPEKCLDILYGFSEDEIQKIQYDVIVIDEAQDVLTLNYIMILDMLIKNGFNKGIWAIFYDPNQNIYNNKINEGLSLLDGYNPAYYKLTLNCRNTKKIATYNSKVTQTEMPQVFDENIGEDVEFKSYDDIEEMKSIIKELFVYLDNENINLSNVVFLSPKRYESSDLLTAMGKNFKINILQDGFKTKDNVPVYSTIHGFKGLDSLIVVLIDVDKIYTPKFNQILYTALSRARTKLYIVAKNQTIEKLKRR